MYIIMYERNNSFAAFMHCLCRFITTAPSKTSSASTTSTRIGCNYWPRPRLADEYRLRRNDLRRNVRLFDKKKINKKLFSFSIIPRVYNIIIIRVGIMYRV